MGAVRAHGQVRCDPPGSYGLNESAYTIFAAAVAIASLPLVVLFAGTQRQLVRAAITGSVKG